MRKGLRGGKSKKTWRFAESEIVRRAGVLRRSGRSRAVVKAGGASGTGGIAGEVDNLKWLRGVHWGVGWRCWEVRYETAGIYSPGGVGGGGGVDWGWGLLRMRSAGSGLLGLARICGRLWRGSLRLRRR